MAITIELSGGIEAALRAGWGDLERAAKEALLIESYRAGKISIGFLAQTLGMGVIEADAWLAKRGVPLNYTADDLEADQRVLDELMGEH